MIPRETIEAAQRAYNANLEHGSFAAMEAALTAALSSQWRDIKSAPRDGDTNILIGCFGEHSHGEQHVVFYDEEVGSEDWPWRTADGIGYHKDLPTHWQPLPPPPTPEEKTGQ